MKYLRQIKALSAIRLRLLWNTLGSSAGAGKIIGTCMVVIIMILATASGASDLLEAIYKLPYANILAEWLVGILISFAIFVVFTGDLVSGHTLNTGQMSSDFTYLSTLPVSTPILVFIKLFERLITDYFGILFLLPALIGVSCYKAYTFKAFLVGFLLYAEIGIVTGLLINLVMIVLTRFFKQSTINNFFSIFGYISAIITIIPVLVISDFNPAFMPKILETLDYIQEYAGWLVAPVRWIATPLLLSTPFCIEFWKITILWLILTIVLTTLFYIAIKHNWSAYCHSNKSSTITKTDKKWLKGLLYKELIMLRSDFNLLVNAIIMPISIIIVEMYFLKKVFSFTSVNSVINFIFGSIIYFSMFGPINIIGYEGKAISLLETMPIKPETLLRKKIIFWGTLALLIFVPATIVTFWIINFDIWVTLKALLQTIAFLIASVWLCVSLSAIFAKYDTTVLQQRSSFIGKTAAMSLLTLLLYAKSFTLLNAFTVILFITMTYLCYEKAKISLAFRQDQEMLKNDNHMIINCFLLFLSFTALETSISQFFNAISPNTQTGAWAWCLSLSLMTPFVILNSKKDTPILAKINLINSLKAIFITVISLGITYIYLALNPTLQTLITSNTKQIIDFGAMLLIPAKIWSIFILILATTFMVAFVRRAEEFFLANSNCLIKFLGCLLVTLISPPALQPVILAYMLMLFLANKKCCHEGLCFYSAITFFATLFWYIIY